MHTSVHIQVKVIGYTSVAAKKWNREELNKAARTSQLNAALSQLAK